METMTYMKVYRLENKDGIGVYQAANYNEQLLVNLRSTFSALSNRHPYPNDDSLLRETCPGMRWMECFFGFDSLKQLRNWFYTNKILKVFSESGITINVYEIPAHAVYMGNTQCCFEKEYRDNRHIVETINPLSLMDLPLDNNLPV